MYILMKMSDSAREKFGGKDGNRNTEWKFDINSTTPEELAILQANGIALGASPYIDCIVLGEHVPGTLIGVPYIRPFFFDEMPSVDEMYQILQHMAETYDAAMAQSTALPPLPPRVKNNTLEEVTDEQ